MLFQGSERTAAAETVLLVDDEEYVLNSAERLFPDTDIRILKATNGDDALELFTREKIAVIVSDSQMPGIMGLELLERVRAISPDTLKILMTGYAELSTAVDAINRGEVYRFIIKPWDNQALVQTIRDAVQRYQIVQTLKDVDESKLLSLAQAIELKDPYTRGHCERVAKYSIRTADGIGLDEAAKRDIRLGSWLHDCGKIGVPENILNKKAALNANDYEMIKNHPAWGADVVRQAKLPGRIVSIVLHHHERYDGGGYPAALEGSRIPLEARIVCISDVFDALISNRPYRAGFPIEKALSMMKLMRGNVFDPELLDIFLETAL